jgi:D-beta-D-heptose 7-phosphate kinase/D-beta-D-heptose 1-phosphate adenosyltransferase
MSSLFDADSLLGALARVGRPRVAVVGDLILDRYVVGDVARISPEAPIPVLAARREELRLGGAGNVAANLAAMGAEVAMVALVGDDGLGRAVRELLEDLSIDASGVEVDAARPTIEKTRLLSGVQQMLRVDREDPTPVEGPVEERVLAAAREAVGRADAVVLSDYGKGLLTPAVNTALIAAARERGIPCLVDPKGSDWGRYQGATLVTPNRKEAEEALGRALRSSEEVSAGAAELIERTRLDHVVITLSADGIHHRSASGAEGRVPAEARQVYDVTGAGDTVVSHLAIHLAAGLELGLAVALANQAAGIVVERLGTHAVTREELRLRLEELDPGGVGKVLVSTEALDRRLEAWRREGRRVVFTNGCFDVLHRGHVEYLRFARRQGDVLLVGVNSDASVARLKGPTRPVNGLEDRMEVLGALEVVDGVVAFEDDTPAALIERVSPAVLVKGEDWRDKGVVGREWVEQHGGRVVLAPLLQGRSTTAVLERARSGEAASGGGPEA